MSRLVRGRIEFPTSPLTPRTPRRSKLSLGIRKTRKKRPRSLEPSNYRGTERHAARGRRAAFGSGGKANPNSLHATQLDVQVCTHDDPQGFLVLAFLHVKAFLYWMGEGSREMNYVQ